MGKNRKIIYQKYINLLKFDVLFALINGMAFVGTTSSNDLGMVAVIANLWFFDALISIGHGYVTYTKFKAFFMPHLYFYIAWVVSLSPVVFLLDEKNAGYFVDVLELSFIFLLFSCVGALVAKIVMVFKKRFSSSEDKKDDDMDEKDKDSKISVLDFLDSKPSEVIPEREDTIKNNDTSN